MGPQSGHMTENNTLLARLADESAIRDLVARFGLAATNNDASAFRSLWAEDCAWVIAEPYPQRAEGRDQIAEMLARFWDGNDFFMQFTTQGPIEIHDDDASSQSLCQEFARGGADRFYRTSGIWSDRFRRTAEGWRFTERSWRYLWVDFSPFTGDIFPASS